MLNAGSCSGLVLWQASTWINDELIHWRISHRGRTTHICVGKLTIIGSDNGLSPGQHQAIIWTIAGILLIGPLGTNFSEILIWIQKFSFKKMHLNMMTSSNGNFFRVTGHLCGEFNGPGEFPAQRPVTWSFDVLFDLHLNKRLSKLSWGWWFETPSRSLWRHCNEMLSANWCPFVLASMWYTVRCCYNAVDFFFKFLQIARPLW